MPGYPCCCNVEFGGVWDLYDVGFMPYILDMQSTMTLQYFANNTSMIDKYNLGYSNRSFYSDTLGITSLAQIIKEKTSPWYVSGLLPISGLSIPKHKIDHVRFSDYTPLISFDSYPDKINHNGFMNLRSDTEKIVMMDYNISTGDLITTSNNIPGTGFNVYPAVFSTRIATDLSLDTYSEIISSNKHDAFDSYESLDSILYSSRNLSSFDITGEYADLGPLFHSRNFTDYEQFGNPTITERFYDIYGSDDRYPGTTASWDTGTLRYSLNQPFFTGVGVYIQHSIDMPLYLFDPIIEGWQPEYTGLPQTGTYVALYGYWNGEFPIAENTLTGIQSTGTQDFYVNNIRNLLVSSPKIPQPIISEFTLNESVLDNYRNPDSLIYDVPLLRLELTIKPDEIRTFIINFNNRTIDLPPYYLIAPELLTIPELAYKTYDSHRFGLGTILHFDDVGEPYFWNTYNNFDSAVTPKIITDYTIDDSGFYHLNMFLEYPIDDSKIDTILSFPEMTGEPICAAGASVDVSDRAAYTSQCKTNYSDLLTIFQNSGYLSFDSLQERSLWITPANTVYPNQANGGDQPPGYIGSSGDGFYFSGATVSFYKRQYDLTAINISPADNDKSVVIANESSIMTEVENDATDLHNSGVDLFPTLTTFNNFPISIMSYNSNYVNSFTFEGKFDNPRGHVASGRPMDRINNNYLQPGYYIKYNVTGNNFTTDEVRDINIDNYHYSDRLVRKNISELSESTPTQYNAIINNSQPRPLVLIPNENCYPIVYSLGAGDSTDTLVSDIDRISYDYYLGNEFSISSIDKFDFNLNSSNEDYAIPDSGTYMATTTIHRPTGELEAQTGSIDFTDENWVSGNLNGSSASVWVYPIYYDTTDIITTNASGPDLLPYTGGTASYILRPKLLDSFVCNKSPSITASGWESSSAGVSLSTTTLTQPTSAGGAGAVIEYETGIYRQAAIKTYPYKYSNYGDNWALMWVEEVDTNGIQKYSFKVNGNYVFEKITGIDFEEIEFKVGPQHLVYILQGTVSSTAYTPYIDKDSNGDKIWCDYVRNSNDRILDPPTLITQPSVTYKIHTASLNGSVLSSFENSSHRIPVILGMTDENFYLGQFVLNSIPDTYLNSPNNYEVLTDSFFASSFADVDTYDSGNNFVDSYRVLFSYNRPKELNEYWRLDYDLSYFSSLYPFRSEIEPDNEIDIDDDLPIIIENGNDILSNTSHELRTQYDFRMITNNSDISESPLSADKNVPQFKLIDYTLPTHVWNPTGNGAGSPGDGYYEPSFDFLTGNNWIAGSDVYIDTNEIRLNSFASGFTGSDVAIYKHLPVTVGETYVLQLRLDTDLLFGTVSDGFELPRNHFDIVVGHSGVFGENGEEIFTSRKWFNTYESGIGGDLISTNSGIDSTSSVILDQNRYKLVYNVTSVDGTGYNPLYIKITSKDYDTFNWNSNSGEPRFLSVIGMSYHQAITGSNSLPDLTDGLYPTISGYEVA